MKALSVKQPWASLIAAGKKTIEVRSRPCHYRGELLICASRSLGRARRDLPRGVAMAIVQVIGCRPMKRADLGAAHLDQMPAGAWAWELAEARAVEPVPIRGRQSFFEVDWPGVLDDFTRAATVGKS